MKDPYSSFQKFTLPNGLTVWHLYKDRTFACFEFVVSAGSREDPSGKEGLAHFIEHLVSRNTPGYPNYSKNAKWFDDTGGRVAFGSTSFLATTYDFKVPLEHIPKALDIFGSMLMRSTIETGIEEQRAVIQREYLRRYATPLSFELRYFGVRDFFPNHRTTHSSPLGIPETISAITKNDLDGFLDRYYCPQNVTVVCAGGMTLENLKELLAGSPFGDAKKGSANSNQVTCIDAVIPTERIKTVHMSHYTKQPINQGVIKRIITLPAHTNQGIVSGLSSVIEDRLFEEIREKRSLTYDVEVGSQSHEGLRYIVIETSVPPENVDETNRLISVCIENLLSERANFDTEREHGLNQFNARDQNLGAIADKASWDLIYYNQILTVEEQRRRMMLLEWNMFEEAIRAMLDENRTMTLFVLP